MLALPFSLQSFSRIREEGCLYVDKTEYAYNLIRQRQSFFLARPRRFGKSVFVSTLKEILLGEKELFKDLWIAKSSYAWIPYGVIHLDFSLIDCTSAKSARDSLCGLLATIATAYGIRTSMPSSGPKGALLWLVGELERKFGQVAVLVDEYDHPILSTLKEPHLQEVLKAFQEFFTALKALNESIQFLFITGVSAFTKAGLFSGANHPDDLSLDPGYACVCGYTEEDIHRYFTPYLQKLAEKKGISLEQLRLDIKSMYNGYHFAADAPSVYNPFSLIKALHDGELNNFWFDSGSPSFLINILRDRFAKKELDIFFVEEFTIHRMEPKYFDVDAIPLPALMLQTGYLTIKGLVEENYLLGFPNREVQTSLQRYILNVLTDLELNRAVKLSTDLARALQVEDIEKVTTCLRVLCAHMPSRLHIASEKFYHALFIAAFQASGVKTLAERQTADGAMDLILELPELLYVVEVKLNRTALEALEQIKRKRYYEPYLGSGKTIWLIGLNVFRETQKEGSSQCILTVESQMVERSKDCF